jgi:hypothetical protein
MRRLHWLICLALVASCGGEASNMPVSNSASPTVSSRFRPVTITPWPTPILRPTRTPAPVATAAPAAEAVATASPAPTTTYTEVVVFADVLNPDWLVQNSVGMNYSVRDRTRVHSGTTAIRITPAQDFGMFLFSVKPGATQVVTRADAFEVSLWLNSGDQEVGTEDLAVTVVGSNAQPYWAANDTSVAVDDKQFFSETRLNYLGVNTTIPPNTWVELRVQLDQLPYEPEYTYITGIYLKNDAGFRQTIYLDDVLIRMVTRS